MIHVVDDPNVWGADRALAICGSEAKFTPEGDMPEGFDFVELANAADADCPMCRQRLMERDAHRVDASSAARAAAAEWGREFSFNSKVLDMPTAESLARIPEEARGPIVAVSEAFEKMSPAALSHVLRHGLEGLDKITTDPADHAHAQAIVRGVPVYKDVDAPAVFFSLAPVPSGEATPDPTPPAEPERYMISSFDPKTDRVLRVGPLSRAHADRMVAELTRDGSVDIVKRRATDQDLRDARERREAARAAARETEE